MAAVALATSSARCDMIFLIMSVQTPIWWSYSLKFRHKKSLHREAYLALFFVSSFTR